MSLQVANGKKLYIQEVAPRDGFQNEMQFIDTDQKIALVDRLSDAGYAKIEVTSFTSPKAIPALRDAEEVMHRIRRNPDVVYTVLVPNVRGAERAMECKVDEINLVMSASETHNRANLRMTRAQSLAQLADVIASVSSERVAINVSLSTVFGCPMEGDIDPYQVFELVGRFATLGAHGVTLCDTTGMAYPSQVARIAREARKLFPKLALTLHFHDTRGMALANTLAALDEGIERFDASLGGLGGCPYAPGASGNACTEDLVHMLNLMGYDTGIREQELLDIASGLPGLIGHELPGHLNKAGLRSRLHSVPTRC
ncbi:hydroxymethylglutaryl-CoA lyase [Paraburkholderia susongensis]|uniref:Hydroxymethylglutaryl-CoA lyase n=1 Tax=Paraburkholderia susongensis TaxID=1515439 RepID=A0A1X7M4S5_9BURK|nr:hydroxymethylglutaryl-CoA lyase [Paraburkholderia susongensis]SMG60389.1 hydroxymethylglutaryl-CoA lyase [Paraburkholderia susongensis]